MQRTWERTRGGWSAKEEEKVKAYPRCFYMNYRSSVAQRLHLHGQPAECNLINSSSLHVGIECSLEADLVHARCSHTSSVAAWEQGDGDQEEGNSRSCPASGNFICCRGHVEFDCFSALSRYHARDVVLSAQLDNTWPHWPDLIRSGSSLL